MENCSPFKSDERVTDPNQSAHRQARFRLGWQNATNHQEYSANALRQLTWENLGYRLGCLFGNTDPALVDAMYDWSVRRQAASGLRATAAD